MFKNLSLFRLGADWTPHGTALETGLAKAPFAPCAPTQPSSAGWAPPRGEAGGALLESVGGQWFARLVVEQRLLPGAVVRRRLDERVAAIDRETGRKPGRRQRVEIKEEIVHELLPRAFTRQAGVMVWIDPKHRLLALDATAAGRIDTVIGALVEADPALAPRPLATATSPGTLMAEWLTAGDVPAAFAIDRECELKAADEGAAAVRYARHPLDIDEVRAHIAAGKRPTRLALTWQSRVSFVLTDALQLRRIAFLDGVFEGTDEPGGFDTDAAISTGELARLAADLLEALGGEPGRAATEALAA